MTDSVGGTTHDSVAISSERIRTLLDKIDSAYAQAWTQIERLNAGRESDLVQRLRARIEEIETKAGAVVLDAAERANAAAPIVTTVDIRDGRPSETLDAVCDRLSLPRGVSDTLIMTEIERLKSLPALKHREICRALGLSPDASHSLVLELASRHVYDREKITAALGIGRQANLATILQLIEERCVTQSTYRTLVDGVIKAIGYRADFNYKPETVIEGVQKLAGARIAAANVIHRVAEALKGLEWDSWSTGVLTEPPFVDELIEAIGKLRAAFAAKDEALSIATKTLETTAAELREAKSSHPQPGATRHVWDLAWMIRNAALASSSGWNMDAPHYQDSAREIAAWLGVPLKEGAATHCDHMTGAEYSAPGCPICRRDPPSPVSETAPTPGLGNTEHKATHFAVHMAQRWMRRHGMPGETDVDMDALRNAIRDAFHSYQGPEVRDAWTMAARAAIHEICIVLPDRGPAGKPPGAP